MRNFILTIMLLIGLTLSAQTEYRFNSKPDGFSIGSRSNTTTTIIHNLSAITLEEADQDGLEGQFITISGIYLPNQAGAPNLPSSSTFVAIPNGAKVTLDMVSSKTKTIKDVDLIPAPQPQLDNDNSKPVYEKDPSIYSRNAFYPETPYVISETTSVRGVEVVQVGVMPFQYNPVTKELIVYEELELRLDYEGGDGQIGDIRYRTPEWDHILSDMLLNREMLPEVDYGKLLRKHYESKETGCQYMIITPDNEDFVQLADSIKKFRTEQGIPTEVFTVTQCGGNNYQTIKNFIKNAYNQWDMPPAAVLILGDHSSDPTLGIVSYTMNNHPGGDGYNPYISDHPYSDMNNNMMSDVIVGRITGRNYDELYHMIKKDLDYERTPPTNPDFYDHPITAMGFQLERWFQLCSEVVNGFWEYGLEKHPVRLNAIYEGTPGSRWSSAENTNTVVNYFYGCGYIPRNMSHLTDWSATGNKVNEAINSGAFLLQHRDHGAEELWGEPSYSIGYIKRLTNTDLTYVMSNNCLTGRFNYGGTNGDGCFAEVFHRHQHGALGLIAATQVSYSFVNDVYVWGMYDNMWPDFMPTYGTQHETNFIRPAFGNAAGKYFLRQSSWTDDYVKEITYYLFHHHGDAYMSLYSEVPQHLDVEMLPVISAGSDQYQVKVDEGATICLTANGEIIGFDYGTGNAQAISITPQAVGTKVKLTIKKQNYYRYEHEIAIIPAEEPYLIFHSVTINDEEGNGNSSADYDETCRLDVSLHNVGFAAINNVKATLSSPHPKIQIIGNEASYGDFNSNGTQLVNNAFTIHFGDDFYDNEPVRLYLQMGNDDFMYRDSIEFRVKAPILNYTNMRLSDLNGNANDRLMKGESTWMTFDVANLGHSKSKEVSNLLTLDLPFLDITENPIVLPEIEAGTSTPVSFQVNLHDDAPEGNILNYSLAAESGSYTASLENEISLGNIIEDFEDNDLNPNMQWGLGNGSKKWYIVEDETAIGGFCMRSPTLTDNKKATLTIGVNCTYDEYFSFYHKTSTEEGDVLELSIGTTEVASWSGITDWEESTFELKPGLNLIRLFFKKDEEGSGGDDCVMVDHFRFPPKAELYLYAGEDTISCPGTFIPNSYVIHQSETSWSTDGDGTFDDPSLERPVYTFGENDKLNGQVTLSVTATSSLNNTQQSQQITIEMAEDLTTVTPTAPTGNTSVDLSQMTGSDYTATMYNDSDYQWSVEPEEAGIIQADGNNISIQWNTDYHGTASLKYKLSNSCGESEYSESLDIEVRNGHGIEESTNPTLVVYPNPANDQIHVVMDDVQPGKVIIRIIDHLGRMVFEAEKASNGTVFEAQINVSTFTTGLYEIQVISENQAYNRRVVIQ